MIKRQARIERIKAVERQYRTAVSAIGLLAQRLRADPNWGDTAGWTASDAQGLIQSAEDTFLIRLFAEFEAGLRDVWANYFNQRAHTRMEHLLARIAGPRYITQDWLDQADEVRRYRNSLVHEGGQGSVPKSRIRIASASAILCRFFSRMPEDW